MVIALLITALSNEVARALGFTVTDGAVEPGFDVVLECSGSAGGARAVESLRLVMGEIKIADVRSQVMLSLHSDFENYTTFKPGQHHEKSVTAMLDEVVSWSGALKTVRERQQAAGEGA